MNSCDKHHLGWTRIRLCSDGRHVNKMVRSPEGTLPTTQMFERMAGSVIFSEFDISSAFLQLPIEEDASLAYGFEFEGVQ